MVLHHYDIMTAGSGNFQRPFDMLLPHDFSVVQIEMAVLFKYGGYVRLLRFQVVVMSCPLQSGWKVSIWRKEADCKFFRPFSNSIGLSAPMKPG